MIIDARMLISTCFRLRNFDAGVLISTCFRLRIFTDAEVLICSVQGWIIRRRRIIRRIYHVFNRIYRIFQIAPYNTILGTSRAPRGTQPLRT